GPWAQAPVLALCGLAAVWGCTGIGAPLTSYALPESDPPDFLAGAERNIELEDSARPGHFVQLGRVAPDHWPVDHSAPYQDGVTPAASRWSPAGSASAAGRTSRARGRRPR